MKLNHECVRDFLIYLEENLKYDDDLKINDLKLKEYSSEELLYTAEKLKEAGFINYNKKWNLESTNIVVVSSLTYNGHQFLDNIRDNNVWDNTKKVLSNFKSTSLSFVSDVSSQIIANIISKHLGLS